MSNEEERKELDEIRTISHNSLIDACNILSRNMEKSGENIEWRKKLGNDRKVIGDFACFVNFVLGLRAR